MRNALCIGFVLLAIIGVSQLSLADSITNGGFETGTLNGWSTAGDVSVIGSFSSTKFGTPFTIAPAEGNFQAAMSNGPTDGGNCTLTPLSCFTFSGNNSAGVPSIASVLDVSIGTLKDFVRSNSFPGSFAFDGSATGQSFFGNAGDVLSFASRFLTYDGPSVDLAVVSLDGSINLINFGGGSLTLTTTGVHHVGFGVFNTIDEEWPSALFIDNVKLTAAVPEPTTYVLFASGMLGLVIAKRRWGNAEQFPAKGDISNSNK